MIIISTTVKANKSELEQIFNFFWTRIDHADNWIFCPFKFPVDQKQIREDLNVVECDWSFFILNIVRRFFRLELHFINDFDAIIGMMRTSSAKCKYRVLHVRDIIFHSAIVCIVKNLINKVDTRFCSRMNLLFQILFYKRSKPFLILDRFEIDHLILSFHRKPSTNRRNR